MPAFRIEGIRYDLNTSTASSTTISKPRVVVNASDRQLGMKSGQSGEQPSSESTSIAVGGSL